MLDYLTVVFDDDCCESEVVTDESDVVDELSDSSSTLER